jgi:hypothetical protein
MDIVTLPGSLIPFNMRAFLYSAIISLVCLSGLFSCIDDTIPNPKPEIDFNPSNKEISLAPGDSVVADTLNHNLKITVRTLGKLKAFSIASSDSSQLLQNITTFPEKSYSTILRSKVGTNKKAGDRIIYSFSATNDKEETTIRTFTVNVK